MITSTYSGEGKTTIALNVSLAFSKIGKVLLVETDIRRPSVLNLINKNESETIKDPGFSDIIQGKAEFSDTMVSIPDSDIDLMASGVKKIRFNRFDNSSKIKRIS